MLSEKDIRSGERELTTFHYSSTNNSYIDPVLTKYWWSKLQSFIPAWITPNLITLSGTATCFLCSLLSFYFFDNYYIFIIGIFIWQTTDAIDGIHARNTNQSSPLGLMMDHIIDGYLWILLTFFTVAGVNFTSDSFVISFSVLLTSSSMYIFNIIPSYSGGKVYFGIIGATEFQFICMSLCLMSEIFGKEMWNHFYLNYLIFICTSLSFVSSLFSDGAKIITTKKYQQNPSNFHLELFHLFCLLFSMITWQLLCNVATEYPFHYWIIYTAYVGLLSADNVIKSVINYANTRNSMNVMPFYLYPLFMVIVSSIVCLHYSVDSDNIVYLMVMIVEVFICSYSIYYITNMMKIVADILKIPILFN